MTDEPLLPLVVDPEDLAARRDRDGLLIVDLCQQDTYLHGHIPGAVHLDYMDLIAPRPPAMGLPPEGPAVARVLGGLGLSPEHHVIAYDDEGGGRAARFIWTLDWVGHGRASLLNGGINAWTAAGLPLISGREVPEPQPYHAARGGGAAVDKDWLLHRLGDPALALVDARSPAEYAGTDRRARRGGHIPGAVNFEWVRAMDFDNHLRLRPAADLRAELEAMNVTPDKEVVTYCQTHHRSSHTYVVLRWLGYPRVHAYPGAWSEWGNSPDTPIE